MSTRKVTSTVLAVLMALLKHRATYRFLAVVLVAVGVTNGEAIAEALMTAVCAFVGCIG